LLLALDGVIERVSLRRLALAGLAATGFQLTGHPEIQFQAGVLSGLFVLVRVCLLPMSWRDRAGRVLVCLAAHLIGLLGAAAAIVPFGEQMLASADWHEATRARESMLPSIALLGALAPDHFGRPRAGRFYQGPEDYVEAGLYFGLVPLLLALTACTRLLQPRRTLAGPAGHAVVIFAPWVLVCGTVVFGVPGVQELLRHLPLFSKADNMRLTLGVQFGGAMIAGAAWTQLNQGAERLVARILLAVSLAAAAILAALLFLPGQYGLYPHWQGLYQLWTDPTVPAPLEHRSLRTVVSLGVAVLSVLWAGAVARSLRRWPGREFPLGVHGMLVLLTVADLVWVAYGFNPIVPARVVFPEAPPMLRRVAEHLDDGRLIATDLILAPNVAMVYRLRDLRGYDFPLDRRWSRLFARLGWGKGGGIKLLPRDQVFPCVPPEVQSVCNKCCVRFLYTSSERMVGEPPETLPLCHEDKIDHDSLPAWSLVIRGVGAATDLVYQNPSAYPRAYFARRVTGTSPDRALEAVLDVSHDFREESFVEDQVGSVAIEADAGSQGEATIEYDGAEEVRIRTRSRAAALLVLSDRFDPNWRVQIDGRPAQALRANYLFRGVAVPAGEHSVRWTYRPVSFVWGCTISVLTVAVLLTSVLFGLIPRRAT
ncbi:MAG: YfhO family protein, partial [Planctomycetes bacterium]|nr:YfhO family protein [Planctomycetota bacterium]